MVGISDYDFDTEYFPESDYLSSTATFDWLKAFTNAKKNGEFVSKYKQLVDPGVIISDITITGMMTLKFTKKMVVPPL